MKAGDAGAGALTALVGCGALVMALRFPGAQGQPIGPGMFPAVVGAALIAFGVMLIATASRRAPTDPTADEGPHDRSLLRPLTVIAAVGSYAFAVDALGFLPTSALFLAILLRAFGISLARTLVMAVTVPLLLHYIFYTLLRVPLPWGVLRGIGW